ncbi:Kinase [Zostera marina]|uniref:Kinase n=1 Tax=Zostera marina TaxID=29655 RepID=A0A0K9NP62_ZOSMR|nr:Kinase [Zostera marina]
MQEEMWRRIGALLLLLLFIPVNAHTDSDDVSALNGMYGTLSSNSQLNSWTSNNGDPCGQSWRGVSCSGSAVTEIRLSGLGLNGYLEGYMLEKMKSLEFLDVSNNNIGANKELPYAYPPKLKHLDLSGNGYTGSPPWAINKMPDIEYLNIKKNKLSGGLGDMFQNLNHLSTIDLSGNSLSGELPHSFGKLSKLKTLYLQNNKFTGTINVLSNLPLENLNIANNKFTGWIPSHLKHIKNLQTHGNSWNRGPAPPSPPGDHNSLSQSTAGKSKSGISGGGVAGIIITLLAVGSAVAFFLIRRKKKRSQKLGDQARAPLNSYQINESKSTPIYTEPESTILTLQPPAPLIVKPPPPVVEKGYKQPPKKIKKILANSTMYSVADLQVATNSFNADENLIGEGSLGRVYRAEFSNGKVVAVKKINSSVLSNPTSGDFAEVVSNVSRLNHQNVNKLVGYCTEHDQHLLVYEFHGNGSLYDFLYMSDEFSRPLTWNTRVKIVLGSAQALEYLHETCSPHIIHKNFKSANILLDAELNPHISDCGLSNLVTNVEDEALDQYMGSGYCAPEVTMSGKYTLKSDVFSFGVVMLELLTGRMPFDSSRVRSEQSLVRWATPRLHDIDALDKMVDPGLKGLYPAKSLSRFADVIALCVQNEPEFRPPMSDIVQALVRLVQRAKMSKKMGGGSVVDEEADAWHGDADMDMNDIML